MAKAKKVDKDNGLRQGQISQYEVILRDLDRKGISDAILSPEFSAPEDLRSNFVFPYEPSREPAIYNIIAKYETF